MKLNETPTFYDVLDLTPDASPQEIREAYLRIKATYSKDSVALYSLIDSSEREDMLKRIQEAYDILSNSEKRKEYDRFYGQLGDEDDFGLERHAAQSLKKKIVSIDRVPPMENEAQSSDAMLVPPTTDFVRTDPVTPPMSSAPSSPPPLNPIHAAGMNTSAPIGTVQPKPAPETENAAQSLFREIEQETEWKGELLKRVREIRRVSLEEMSQTTKISKTYLIAIEEENFPKLPAAVYVRGFVTQVARVLKLPYQKVAAAYMVRFNQYAEKHQ